jgi:hypothetical protein
MADREEAYLLQGKIQMDDAYLGGELLGGRAGLGSENKIPIVAAVSLNQAGHPNHARITAVSGFSSDAIAEWAKRHLMPGGHVLSDELACFRAATNANCHHKAVVTGGKHPNELPQFRWINTLTSRPASATPSTPTILTNTPGGISVAIASALTGASRWLR